MQRRHEQCCERWQGHSLRGAATNMSDSNHLRRPHHVWQALSTTRKSAQPSLAASPLPRRLHCEAVLPPPCCASCGGAGFASSASMSASSVVASKAEP